MSRMADALGGNSRNVAELGNSSAISISGVWAGYGKRSVLSGMDIEIGKGSLIGIGGPNGVGKSTLMKLIAGVIAPQRGSVRVDGNDMSKLSAKNRARLVAVVPQMPELPAGARALEVVLMGRNPHLGLLSWETEDDLSIAIDTMRMTDTDEFIDRPVDRLSGGERQRVAIAMALAQRAPVMLLDEPTANLDLAYQPAIMQMLVDLAALGKTVVTAVHDLTLAAQFCDKIALMSEGRFVAAGTPSEVLTANRIRDVYRAEVRVIDHPETGRPIVVNSLRRLPDVSRF